MLISAGDDVDWLWGSVRNCQILTHIFNILLLEKLVDSLKINNFGSICLLTLRIGFFMNAQNEYFLKRKKRDELANSVRMYSESEPPEVQFENMWEVVSRSTGKTLQEAQPDFSEFSPSDRMYPSMMAPDVKKRWDMKNLEWENQKEKYRLIKRMARAQFLLENKDLPLARDLAKTAYGKELLLEAAQSVFMDSESNRAFGLHGTSQGVSDRSFDAPTLPSDEEIGPEKKEIFPFWTFTPSEGACEKCQALKGKTYKKKPKRPHPNCKCRIEIHNIKPMLRTIFGTLNGLKDFNIHSFKARGDIRILVSNLDAEIVGVTIDANSSWKGSHLMPLGGMEFVFEANSGDPTPWKVKVQQEASDSATLQYIISYYEGEILK